MKSVDASFEKLMESNHYESQNDQLLIRKIININLITECLENVGADDTAKILNSFLLIVKKRPENAHILCSPPSKVIDTVYSILSKHTSNQKLSSLCVSLIHSINYHSGLTSFLLKRTIEELKDAFEIMDMPLVEKCFLIINVLF